MCSTHVRRVKPLLAHPWDPSSSCHFACRVKARLSSPSTTNCTCGPMGICHVMASCGGECNRSPLIIFNTAAAERLKTKSQLRKELWGWSKPPPLCRDGGWEDFGFRLHLWPQSTKSPSSLCLWGQHISIFMPSFHPPAHSPLTIFSFCISSSELLRNAQLATSTSFQMVLKNSPATHGMTHLQPKNSSQLISVTFSYKTVI